MIAPRQAGPCGVAQLPQLDDRSKDRQRSGICLDHPPRMATNLAVMRTTLRVLPSMKAAHTTTRPALSCWQWWVRLVHEQRVRGGAALGTDLTRNCVSNSVNVIREAPAVVPGPELGMGTVGLAHPRRRWQMRGSANTARKARCEECRETTNPPGDATRQSIAACASSSNPTSPKLYRQTTN
jgi:hypothetical protein